MKYLILDTSFLIFLASDPSIRLSDVLNNIPNYKLVILECVLYELKKLCISNSIKKSKTAKLALDYASSLKKIQYTDGEDVDKIIINYAYKTNSIVATMDSELRTDLRNIGIPVISKKGKRLFIEGISIT